MRIRKLNTIGAAEIAALGDLLIDCVEGGASVSFMWPMTRAKADAFWHEAAEAVARGDRQVWVAEDAAGMLGTVSVLLRLPENQPHRAEIAKMLVHRRARKQGIGGALLKAAEAAAGEAGKSLLVLDTVTGGDAERMYTRHGWNRCGVIPDFALWPDGRPCATTVFYKHVTGKACSALVAG